MNIDASGRLTKKMLNCPFCGGKPFIKESQDGDGYGHVLIGCGDYNCAGYLMLDEHNERGINLAIEKWNKRDKSI